MADGTLSGILHGVHLILYVHDQERSTEFYTQVLAQTPRLHVPGMTEFDLPGGAVLGLMPVAGIKRLIGPVLPDPDRAAGIPRAEIYLRHSEAQDYFDRALAAGAQELSPMLMRDWGDIAGYCLDPDGHVLAFACSQ